MKEIGIKWSEVGVIDSFSGDTMVCVIDKYGTNPENNLISINNLVGQYNNPMVYQQATKPENAPNYSTWISTGTNERYLIINNIAIGF